jgi:hypothetical protein
MTPRRSIARWNGRALNSRFIIISGILVQDHNKRHTCPGSGAGAPARIQSCGRDIPVGFVRILLTPAKQSSHPTICVSHYVLLIPLCPAGSPHRYSTVNHPEWTGRSKETTHAEPARERNSWLGGNVKGHDRQDDFAAGVGRVAEDIAEAGLGFDLWTVFAAGMRRRRLLHLLQGPERSPCSG